MNAIYDSKKKFDLLAQLLMMSSGKHLLEFKPEGITIGASETPSCTAGRKLFVNVNLRKISDDTFVHLRVDLENMKISLLDGKAGFSIETTAPNAVVYNQMMGVQYDKTAQSCSRLIIGSGNFAFLNRCKTPQQYFTAYGVFSGDTDVMKALLENKNIRAVEAMNSFGYVLEIEKNDLLFLYADFSSYTMPFRRITSQSVAKKHCSAWGQARVQKIDGSFFYFDGEVFTRRFGRYVTNREALQIMQRCSSSEDVVPYKHPIAAYYLDMPIWIIASGNNVDKHFYKAVSLNRGEVCEILYESFARLGCLADADDCKFCTD